MNFKKQFLRQSKDLDLRYIPSKKTLILGGALGTFYYLLNDRLNYSTKDRKFWLTPGGHSEKSNFVLGQILLSQSCLGVVLGYRCQLSLVGIGYSATIEKGNSCNFLVLKLGFSHQIKVVVPDFLEVICLKPRIILIKGISLQRVNNFAALIRDLKLPNQYKEKGLYYKDEVPRLKQGKKT